MTVATTVATETSEDQPQPHWKSFRVPGGYTPIPYRLGPVCETCWMDWTILCAIGKDGCNHK